MLRHCNDLIQQILIRHLLSRTKYQGPCSLTFFELFLFLEFSKEATIFLEKFLGIRLNLWEFLYYDNDKLDAIAVKRTCSICVLVINQH